MWLMSYLISLWEFVAYAAAHHKGAVKMFQLHFKGSQAWKITTNLNFFLLYQAAQKL